MGSEPAIRQHFCLLVPASMHPPPSIPPSLPPSLWSALPPPTLLSSASNEVIPSSRVKCSKCSQSRSDKKPVQGSSSGGDVRSCKITGCYQDQLLAARL